MSRDILTNKWVLGGVSFLIVLSVACVLWYQHDTADERKAAAEAEELLRQSEAAKKVSDTDSVTEKTADVVSVESKTPTAGKPITKSTPVKKETESPPAQADVPAQTTETEDMLISPNGFGPYPEIPAEMGIPADKVKIAWEALSENPRHELLFRVRVKLYQQGIKATGATYLKNELIYPIIKGVSYVEFDEIEYPDGSVERYVSGFTGHPDDDFIRGVEGPVLESDIPTHLKIHTYPDGGIDPYQFLDLPK